MAAEPVVIPPAAAPPGVGYAELSVRWQKYANQQPPDANPLLDDTGDKCAAGQEGHVFYLVGGFGTAAKNRVCSIPPGKMLFFPLINCNWIHVPIEVPILGDNKTTVPQVWDALQSPTEGCGPRDNASHLHAKVDGTAIQNLDDPATTPYYVCAGPLQNGCGARAFSLTFPAENLYTALGVPLPAGTYFPVVADGYYLLLAPLRPGTHTVEFGGSGGVGPLAFTQEINYKMNVR